jgi:predicted metal-dependent hydrolase
MSFKKFSLDGIGEISIYKNKKSRSLKLSIKSDGQVRLTIPIWLTYSAGLRFIEKNKQWIQKHERPKAVFLEDQQKIGKSHRLVFFNKDIDSIRTTIKDNYINVYLPMGIKSNSKQAQDAAINASKRALKNESIEMIPSRVQQISEARNFTYSSVSLRSLKGRWGSCSSKKELTFNIFLMQLPWHLIDYVIIHELVHTKHMNHSSDFWNEFSNHLENPKSLRNEMKNYSPVISIVD